MSIMNVLILNNLNINVFFAETTCATITVINSSRNSTGNSVGSSVTYTCADGRRFKDGRKQMTITCQEQGTWDETPTDCSGLYYA